MTDCFAHAAYGVVLGPEEDRLVRAWMADFLAGNPDGEWDAFLDRLDEDGDMDPLRKRVGAPAWAVLIRTGDEDDFLGRCETGPDTFILGRGLYGVEGHMLAGWPEADWHTWVTAG